MVGDAIGFAQVVQLNPVAGAHAYVLPAIAVVPIIVDVVEQVNVADVPAFAVGGTVFTVIVTDDVAVQPFAPVTVTVYVVVAVGFAVGFAHVPQLNPHVGDQE